VESVETTENQRNRMYKRVFPFSQIHKFTKKKRLCQDLQGNFKILQVQQQREEIMEVSQITLNDLPEEILIIVLRYLSLHSLAKLSQVNRHFHNLCRDFPVLRTKFPFMCPGDPSIKKSKLLPDPSLCHAAVVWGNKMWVHGGHNTIPYTQLFDEVKKDFHSYDFEKNTWKKVKARHCPRKTEHSCVTYKDKMYLFGGYNGCDFTNSLFSFDFNKKKWKEVVTTGDIPSVRSAHVGVVMNDKMYIFGGWNGKVQNNDFFEFDFATSTWTRIDSENEGAVPSPRCSHAGIAVPEQNKLYIFGGCGGSPVIYNNELWCYDFTTKCWTQQPTPLAPRSRMKMVKWKDYIYIYSGWNRKAHFIDLYEFNLTTHLWRNPPLNATGCPPLASEQYSLVEYNNMLYIYGGFHSFTNSSGNQLVTIRLWFPKESGLSYPQSL